jgi:hypothetical protein
MGDIEVYSNTIYWLIEVTLIRSKTQQLNSETTSVIRHFIDDNQLNRYLSKYLSFVAPFVHDDTTEFFDFSIIKHKTSGQQIFIKPYRLNDFVQVTLSKRNFEDMKNYTAQVVDDFRNKLM